MSTGTIILTTIVGFFMLFVNIISNSIINPLMLHYNIKRNIQEIDNKEYLNINEYSSKNSQKKIIEYNISYFSGNNNYCNNLKKINCGQDEINKKIKLRLEYE